MTKNIITYGILVAGSLLGTLIFMVSYADVFAVYGWADWLQVLWHALPHHLTVAGYAMALPLVLTLVHVWLPGRWYAPTVAACLTTLLLPILLLWMVDLVLYGYWGFRLDATPLIYMMDNPRDALAESPTWALVGAVVVLLVAGWAIARATLWLYADGTAADEARRGSLVRCLGLTGWTLLQCGLCFLAIRGGVGTSTMNVGRAYFSTEAPLNHAATNPAFSFVYSATKHKDFSKQYRFMSEEALAATLAEMAADASTASVPVADDLSAEAILTTQRPNILLILFESFSGACCQALYPEADPGWMPTFNRLYDEGIGWERFYANSFRTDRGVAAVLASYPGQPTNTVMKDQSKCNNLQYLSRRLGEHGYALQFIHGGDVNFTNMQGFLRAGGITDVVGDTHFPLADRLSKWGVQDDLMFPFVLDAVQQASTQEQPFMKVFLTLSSHEPFEVPSHRYDDPYLNTVAYTDSCFGAFIDSLRQTPAWDDLLIIALPDHCFAKFPAGIQQHEPLRYHAPMVWTGGAVAAPRRIATIGQQTDLAATLLGLMGIDHADFNFSKDMLDATSPHYAFYAFSDGFGFLTDSCCYVQDNQHDGHPLTGSNDPTGRAERYGKAYLQALYNDLSKR